MSELDRTLSAFIIEPDPAYLAAMRRLLTRILPHWQLTFFSDAASFTEQLLAGENPDLILTDCLDHQVSGEELLAFCQDHTAATIRVLMSAENSDHILLATTQSAQMVLGKPFTDQQLLQLFQRVEYLVRGPFSIHSRYQIGQIQTLPMQQRHYQSLLNLLNDSESDTRELAQLIARDAPLAAKLVQIANSAYLGFSRQTLDLVEVVVRLGRERVKAVIQAVQLHSFYEGKIKAEVHAHLLEHSFALATMASQLAKSQHRMDATLMDKAFIAGLMQVLGPLVLMAAMPLAEQKLTDEDMFQEGTADHCVLSAYLMTLWGFSAEISDAVLYRLNLAEVAEPTLLQSILHLATYTLLYQHADKGDSLPLPCWEALQQFALTEAFCGLQQQVELRAH